VYAGEQPNPDAGDGRGQLFLRLAKTFEDTAELADRHAARCRSRGESDAIERLRVAKARAAAARARELASRLGAF
jgi:hypothetical protein